MVYGKELMGKLPLVNGMVLSRAARPPVWRWLRSADAKRMENGQCSAVIAQVGGEVFFTGEIISHKISQPIGGRGVVRS